MLGQQADLAEPARIEGFEEEEDISKHSLLTSSPHFVTLMSAASFKDQGNKFLTAGAFDDAIAAYTKAIELDSSDHVFFSNRSAAFLSKGDAFSALQDGEECIRLNPSFVKGYSRKGAALHALKRYDEALAAYDQGLLSAPTDAGLLNGKSEVQKAQAAAESRGGAGMGGLFGPQMISKLAAHPKFGPKLADPTFMMKLKMIQTNPQMMMSDPEMMEVLQVVLGGMGGGMGEEDDTPFTPPPARDVPKPKEPAKPEPPLSPEEQEQRAIKKRASDAKDRGNALYKERKFSEALAAYDEARSIDPSNIMFLNNKAAVYIEMGETDTAIALCEEALELAKTVRASFEDKAKVYQRIGGAHLKKNDLRAAIAAYNKAQMEQFDKAIERKVKNLELDLRKSEKEAYVNPELALEAKERGNTAFREGKFGDAVSEYEEAIKRDPTNAAYRNNLAAALQKIGDFNGAKAQVEKSIELDKNYVKAWAKKGDIEFFMKEYHKAMDSYRVGLQIEPDNKLCREGLAKVQSKVQSANYEGVDEERRQHAMADPEIQAILQDPSIRQILNDFSENPTHAQRAMGDPHIRAKIEKLMAAGILQMR